MAAEVKKEIQLEVAHVLFIDVVGYSKLSINEQRAVVEELTTIVRGSDQYQKAEAAGRLIKIPAGDGMALVFYTSQEAPAQCAIEISGALKAHPRLQVRMGVHSGPVSGVIDVNGHANLAGAGINMAQRVMACGDAGHILVSKHVAEDLEEYEHWRPLLHDLGACEVKHRGARLHREPLRRRSRQSTTAKEVPSSEEAQRASALGDDDGSVARARGNRRWYSNVFPLSRAIDAGCAREEHRGAALCKPERGQSERLLCRGHPRRN